MSGASITFRWISIAAVAGVDDGPRREQGDVGRGIVGSHRLAVVQRRAIHRDLARIRRLQLLGEEGGRGAGAHHA